jgi:hypothetical protein
MTATTLVGVLLSGLASARPAASAVAAGSLYSATDTGVISQSDGVSTWSTWGGGGFVHVLGPLEVVFDASAGTLVTSLVVPAGSWVMKGAVLIDGSTFVSLSDQARLTVGLVNFAEDQGIDLAIYDPWTYSRNAIGYISEAGPAPANENSWPGSSWCNFDAKVVVTWNAVHSGNPEDKCTVIAFIATPAT